VLIKPLYLVGLHKGADVVNKNLQILLILKISKFIEDGKEITKDVRRVRSS